MVNHGSIRNFLSYNYFPFSKKQCIQRVVSLWVLSFIPAFIGAQSARWVLFTAIPNIIVSIIFLLLIIRYPQLRISRYLCDGLTYLYIAIILMLAAYRIITLESGKNIYLLLILVAIFMVDLMLFVVITLHNIAIDKYNPDYSQNRKSVIPFIFGLGGFLIASFSLYGKSKEIGITVLATCLMILSLILGVGSLNLMKAYFHIKIKKNSE